MPACHTFKVIAYELGGVPGVVIGRGAAEVAARTVERWRVLRGAS
jgi:hypothetical protein